MQATITASRSVTPKRRAERHHAVPPERTSCPRTFRAPGKPARRRS